MRLAIYRIEQPNARANGRGGGGGGGSGMDQWECAINLKRKEESERGRWGESGRIHGYK